MGTASADGVLSQHPNCAWSGKLSNGFFVSSRYSLSNDASIILVTQHFFLTDVVSGNTQHRMAPTAIGGPQFGPSATS